MKWAPITFTDEQAKQFAAKEAARIAEIPGWQIRRGDANAPCVHTVDGLEARLAESYRQQIGAFKTYDTKENLPKPLRDEQLREWVRPAAMLIKDLETLLGDKDAARALAGGIIGISITDYMAVTGRGVAVPMRELNTLLSTGAQGQNSGLKL